MSKLVGPGSKYTDEQRMEAAVLYVVKGSMAAVEKELGIPNQTLSNWKNADWWDTLVGKVRDETNDLILAQNLQIATKAAESTLDSLENGDEKLVWDKAKGEHVIKRVKPSGKDSMVISGISQDKARVQMNLPTSISSTENAQTQITALANQFAELSRHYKAKDITAQTIVTAKAEVSKEAE